MSRNRRTREGKGKGNVMSVAEEGISRKGGRPSRRGRKEGKKRIRKRRWWHKDRWIREAGR